ncbi:AEC family transporter [Comamonas aquatica]|uniref:AEC family transporter n=1 Tax=Comamonas aquatica TaxID=225991 RepID=UPI0030B93A05
MAGAAPPHQHARPCRCRAGGVPLQLLHRPGAGGPAGGCPGAAVHFGAHRFCVPMFNIAAVWPMTREGQHSFWGQLIRNPLIVATVCGLCANLLGFRMPSWLEPPVARIGAASIALGLMSAGAGMQLGLLTHAKRLSIGVLGIRHLLQPLIALGAIHVFGLQGEQALVLLLFSALPTASTCYVLAARMGYNGPYVAGLVTLSTILGVLSLPYALSLTSLLPTP